MSKVGMLKDLLLSGTRYTVKELAEITGLKESTVKCQLGYHLRNKGFKTIKEKAERGVVYHIEEMTEDEILYPKEVVKTPIGGEPINQEEPTKEDLLAIPADEARPATDPELQAILDE